MATRPLNENGLAAARRFAEGLPELGDDPLPELESDDLGDEPPAQDLAGEAQPQTWTEACARCRGTGLWNGRLPCMSCNGNGTRTFRTSPEQRAARAKPTPESRAKYQDRREREQQRERERAEKRFELWCEQNPSEGAWLRAQLTRTDGGTSNFVTACQAGIYRYGSPTANMLKAIRNAIVRDAERQEQLAAERLQAEVRAEPVNRVNLQAVEEAFGRALQAGIRSPKLTLDGFTLSPAKAASKNAGAIYVKKGREYEGLYLGKVLGGAFLPTRECDEDTKAKVLAAMADPLASAVAYGKKFGKCAVCYRDLTDPESIERGIGPICAERMGWA